MTPTESAVWYVESHLASEMTLAAIARFIGVTPSHLARLFQESTGLSVMRYARARRLSEASLLNIEIEERGAWEIARRSRGTPRVANRLLKRVRDYAQIAGDGIITSEIADKALAMLEVDAAGLDRTDRAMLEAIIRRFGGGPVGLDTLAAAISEETETVEDVYEPFLLQLGYLQRTPRGRTATMQAYEHLGIPFPGSASAQQDESALF